MQDERIEQRVRAAYRARACAAGVACGAQIFAVGTGLLLPLALNAAYWAAVPALLLSGVIGLAAPRRLSKAPGSAFCAVLALSLLVCGALLLAAGATLAQQTLLPNGHLLTCLMLTLGFCLLAARPSACAAAQSVETAPIRRAKSWASVSSACTKPSRGRALERIVILAPQTC